MASEERADISISMYARALRKNEYEREWEQESKQNGRRGAFSISY